VSTPFCSTSRVQSEYSLCAAFTGGTAGAQIAAAHCSAWLRAADAYAAALSVRVKHTSCPLEGQRTNVRGDSLRPLGSRVQLLSAPSRVNSRLARTESCNSMLRARPSRIN